MTSNRSAYMHSAAHRSHRRWSWLLAVCAAGLLAGCGGGSGGSSGGVISLPTPVPPTPSPAPSPEPTPSPTPSPSPTPTQSFPTPAPLTPITSNIYTQEFTRSDGPELHTVATAWQKGATGSGVTLAIIDTGIDTANTEFSGRISAASADVAGTRTIEAEDSHGTQVALVAAAARNDSGVLGIAFDATLQVLRADAPGSCTGAGATAAGCAFNHSAIAGGVDRAIAAGARVINISLGNAAPDGSLTAAVARAANAGVIVVVSAGNGGAVTDGSVDPSNPDPFATGLRQAGNGNVIIAGSVDADGTISNFSNRAGSEADYYLMALGNRVCCLYSGSAIETTTAANGQQQVTVLSGTSFAAPQISGAVALLAQAFPNLTGAQIVDLLLKTARDAGASGTDAIYGRGILDIGRAFQPQGTTTLAGTTQQVPMSEVFAITSAAMGDATQGAALGAVVLDGYSRAFSVNLAARIRAAAVPQRLHSALATSARAVALGSEQTRMAFSIARDGRSTWSGPLRLAGEDAERARVLAASVMQRLNATQTVGFSYRQSGDVLAAQLQGRREPAFLISTGALRELGIASEGMTFGYRHQLGQMGLTLTAESGDLVRTSERDKRSGWNDAQHGLADRVMQLGVALDRQIGQLAAMVGVTWLQEDRTVLGARFADQFGGSGASSLFADIKASWDFAPAWQLGLAGRVGRTLPEQSGRIAPGSQLVSSAWSIDLARNGVLAKNDALAFRVSQPLRVESGGLQIELPTGYDYATRSATFGIRQLPLAPKGRELIGELAWRGVTPSGDWAASVFWRTDPGHYAGLPDDQGVAVRWSRGF